MISVGGIYDFINDIAPFSSALSYDNVGLIVGDKNAEVSSVIVALDVTPGVIKEAAVLGAELVVSHHPVIFNPIKRIRTDDIVCELIKNNISVISAHTNLDMAKGGVNDALAADVGLKNTEVLVTDGVPLGRIGTIEETSVETFAAYVKNKLSANAVRYVRGNKKCGRIAVIGGSGGDAVDDALAAGADTLLVGEAKYNHFHYAEQRGINLIEAGHFATENVVVPVLSKYLSDAFPDVNFSISKENIEIPFVI